MAYKKDNGGSGPNWYEQSKRPNASERFASGEDRPQRGGGRGKPASGERPAKPYGRPATPAYGERAERPAKPYGRPATPAYGERAERPAKPYGRPANPAYGERAERPAKPYGRPATPAYGERAERPTKPYGRPANPAYGERAERPAKPYGRPANPAYGERAERPAKPYGRPANPAYGERAERPAKPYGRPAAPAYGERAERPAKPYGRPAAPHGNRPDYAERAPRAYDAPERDYDTGFAVEPDLPRENMLVGRNPIREAIKAGRDMEKLLIARGDLSGSAREIVAMAKERHIIVQEVDRTRLDALAPSHQGMVAFASAFQYSTVEDILALAEQRGEPPFLVILDGITDPHNLGAIIRTAECVGAHGVIIPERRAVGLTPAAVKASAGAIEHLKVARTGNLTRLIKDLQAKNIWVYAAVMDGQRYDQCDMTGAVALVIGAEGEGVSRLVQENCDFRIALPLKGKLDSLNASVAAGVLLYEVLRRREP